MKYVSGVYGLNIENSKETCGDWHNSALDWSKVLVLESDESIWGDWGIEYGKRIPDHNGLFAVADDMRSILDLMYMGRTGYLKGFRNDFMCTDVYNDVFFEKVYMLRRNRVWSDVNTLMRREYMWDWVNFLKRKGESCLAQKISYTIPDATEETVDSVFLQKISSLGISDSVQDLYDIVYMYTKYKNMLCKKHLSYLSSLLAHNGSEYYIFMIEILSEDKDAGKSLIEGFNVMYKELGLR